MGLELHLMKPWVYIGKIHDRFFDVEQNDEKIDV